MPPPMMMITCRIGLGARRSYTAQPGHRDPVPCGRAMHVARELLHPLERRVGKHTVARD